MKKVFRQCSLVLSLLFLTQSSLRAQTDRDVDNDNDNNNKDKKFEFVKKKSVNKSYNVSSSDKLSIENSFGKVEVHVWEKNEIKVDVDVEVSANTEEAAQKIFDRISIKDSQSGKEISFKTDMKDTHNDRNSKGDKSTMSINYSISMPASNPLRIQNDFGSITLPDYKGEVDLVSKFGKLNTGNLSSVKNVEVEFGKAKIGNISGGKLSVKYSKASIASLSGSIKLNLEFSSKVVLNLDNSLNNLDLNASYSTVNLKPLGALPASYTVSTSFGSFKNKTDIKFNSDDDDDDHGPKFDHEYSGKSGSGNVPVKVKSNFSTIILGDATEDDMKGKDKEKNKDKKKLKTKEI
ncbi:MAG: hypothetical protein QM737_04415 [Ferruginibacter sp.]